MERLKILFFILAFTANVAIAKDQTLVDPDCVKMATNAKSFATLKVTGVATTPEAFASFIVSPTVQSYPIKSIVKYVFEAEGQSPDQIYNALYGRCLALGYKDLYAYFQEREASDVLRAQLNDVKVQLATSTADYKKLANDYNTLRQLYLNPRNTRPTAPPAPTPIVRVYGSPIETSKP